MEGNKADAIKYQIARNIRAFRESRGLSQKELADKLGVVKSSISNYETGVSTPHAVVIYMICDVLDITPSMLFGWR